MLDVEVIVAIISTTGVLGAAVLPAYISNRKKTHQVSETTDTISKKIGEPNGHGSITNLLEEILGLVRDTGRRTSRIESRLDEVERRLNERT